MRRYATYGGLFEGQARNPGSPTTGTPKPLYATPGNHDYEYNAATYFRQSFFTGAYNGPAVGGIFYSKDIAGIHVVMFDSHWITGGWGDQYVRNVTAADVTAVTNWLVADLDAHRGQVTVIVEHEPAYPISSQHPYSENDCTKMRTYWYPIFAAHGVDLVVAGHDHAYQRQDPAIAGLHSYVAPSAGQALYTYTPGAWTRAWSSTPGFLEVTVTGTRIQTRDVQQDGAVYDTYAYDAVP